MVVFLSELFTLPEGKGKFLNTVATFGDQERHIIKNQDENVIC